MPMTEEEFVEKTCHVALMGGRMFPCLGSGCTAWINLGVEHRSEHDTPEVGDCRLLRRAEK